MKRFIFLVLIFLCATLSAEAVYDSNGRLLRSSRWLESGKNPKKEDTPDKTIEEVVESQKDEESDVGNPEQLSMTENSVVEGRGFSDRTFSSDEIDSSHESNLGDFLQSKGILQMRTGGSGSKSEISFKGFTSFCIKVYVDGILANNPTTGEFDWNSIDINTIESIRISEIPELGVTEFAGCAIFITTKKGKNSVLKTETSVSSFESKPFDGVFQSVNYSSNFKNFFYRVGATTIFSNNEFFIENARRNLFNFSKQGNCNFSWNIKIPLENSNVKEISLSGLNTFAYNSLKVFGSGDSLKNGIEEDYTTQHNINCNLELEKIKLKTTLSYFYGQVDYFENRTIVADEKTITNSQSVEIRETMNWIFDATLGYKEEHLFSGIGDRHKIDLGASKTFSWKIPRDEEKSPYEFSVTPCVQLLTWGGNSGGGKPGETWQFKVLPRLTISFFDFYISGYRIFTLPTFNQLYWQEDAWSCGNPDLKPEFGWAASIGFKRQNFPVYASFTYSYYANKIRWGTDSGKYKPLNTTNADYFVGTLGYEQEVWKNHLMLKADFNLTEARLRETGKQIMWVPQIQAHAAVAFKYSFFQFTADYSFTGKRYISNVNIEAYPAFHLLDIGVDFKINNEFTIYAKGTNILDERVVYHDNYYIPSRKYTIGLKFEK